MSEEEDTHLEGSGVIAQDDNDCPGRWKYFHHCHYQTVWNSLIAISIFAPTGATMSA